MKVREYPAFIAKLIKNLAPPVRTLLRLIMVLVACIVLTAMILSFSFSSFMKQSLVNKSINDINIVHASYENMNDTAKSILLTFYYDYRVQQLIDSEYVDYMQIHKALLNVSSYYQHHPYVSTYYFINRDTNYVFCNDGAYRLEDFPDQELIQILSANDQNIKFKPIHRQGLSRTNWTEETVFTYVYFDVYDNEIDPKIIVVNLSEDYFLEQITNTIEDGSRVDIYDPEGGLIFSTDSNAYEDSSLLLTDLSDDDSLSRTLNIDGQKTLVCCQSYSDAIIVKYIPYSYVTAFTVGFVKLSFVISAGLLAAVLIILVFSSFKLLKSFSLLHSRYVRSQGGTQTRQKQNVVKEILLNASPITLKELRSEYDALFGTRQDSQFCVAVCKVDHMREFDEAFNSTYRNSFLYSIINVTEEMFAPMANACGIMLDNSTVAIVFSHLTDAFRPASIEETFRSAITMFQQQFQYSFSVAVSEVTTDINQAYQSACTLVPYRFLLGYQSVIFYSTVSTNETIDWQYPTETEQIISRYISSQQWDKATETIDDFIRVIKTVSYEDARSAINRLLYSIQITMDSMKMGGVAYPCDIQAIYPQFYEAEVLDEIRDTLQEALRQIGCHGEEFETALHQNEQLVSDVKRYITEHYHEFNLSLNTISEAFHTSPNVLGRIFKPLAGKPVFQYITQVRLQHAQELLLHSSLTNKEIALACGFENTSYFYSLFKQELGLTPSEYRKRHKI